MVLSIFIIYDNSEFFEKLLIQEHESELPIYENDVESLVKISTVDDIINKRIQLVSYIWKESSIQSSYPENVEKIHDKRYDDMSNLKEIEKIEIDMEYDVNSIAYHFIPLRSNNKLVIYHQGHDGDFILGKKTIQFFLDRGYSVLGLSMPLTGMNDQPFSKTNHGQIKLTSHKYFELLESRDFSPIKFFFEPISASLNYLDAEYNYDEYYAVGLSGGGWTVTVYSAIDERITKTVSVAGTVPFFMRTVDENLGDYEQLNSELYEIADYLDLYIMAAYNVDRKYIQIFNKYDPCCFAGDQFYLYQDIIKHRLKKINAGYFEVYLDEKTKLHEISDYSLEKIQFEFEH